MVVSSHGRGRESGGEVRERAGEEGKERVVGRGKRRGGERSVNAIIVKIKRTMRSFFTHYCFSFLQRYIVQK